MSHKKTPLQIVKDQFGGKAELAKKVAALFSAPEGEDEAAFVDRLGRVANKKLLHLHALGQRLAELGGKDKLVAKVAELRGQAKDADFVAKLGTFTPGRLLDMFDSLTRRAKRAKASAG
jgi:hypothetical protein